MVTTIFKKQKKGMTVIETIVSFVIITLAILTGTAAILSGGHYYKGGADLKKARDAVGVDWSGGSASSVTITGNGVNNSIEAVEQETDGFVRYIPKED